jgi:hypothetical protein
MDPSSLPLKTYPTKPLWPKPQVADPLTVSMDPGTGNSANDYEGKVYHQRRAFPTYERVGKIKLD